MEYLLLGCLGGVSGLPPQRSKDYTKMKTKNYDTSNDVKEKAPKFYKILSKWIKCDPSDYLLFSSNQNKLTSSQITKLLNNIFDKRVSVDLLRHIYLGKSQNLKSY